MRDLSCSSMALTRLYLVRHGEQDQGPAGGLSPLGRTQADRLGRRLSDVRFSTIHHSPLARAVQTADIVAAHLPRVPRHACDHVADRTPVPSVDRRADYPKRRHSWLDRVPADERDDDAVALRAAVAHFGVAGDKDRRELLIRPRNVRDPVRLSARARATSSMTASWMACRPPARPKAARRTREQPPAAAAVRVRGLLLHRNG